METGQLDVEYISRTVNLLNSHFRALLVSLTKWCADVIDECSFKRAVQDGLFVFHEYLGAFVDKYANDGCS